MAKIIAKQELAAGCFSFEVEAPLIARKAKAGQFIVLKVDEAGERIPLTIAKRNPGKGAVTIIFQVVGKSTDKLSRLNQGDEIQDFVGPLGKPTHIEDFGTVVCIGGGIGIAPILPILKALREKNNHVISIIGARNKELLILEDEVREDSRETFVTTDDGSYGRHGFVTDELKNLVENGTKPDVVIAIGPLPMMWAVCRVTKGYNIPTIVSLNPIMVDGTGMCGGCRVSVDGKSKFVCVDGPEFDGHLVDFAELRQRQATYLTEEKRSYDLHKERCGRC